MYLCIGACANDELSCLQRSVVHGCMFDVQGSQWKTSWLVSWGHHVDVRVCTSCVRENFNTLKVRKASNYVLYLYSIKEKEIICQ